MLYVVMKKMIDRDQSILGTMKAFGMTDGEMLSAYLLEGLLIGVLGVAIGAATAGILGRYMFALYVEFFNLPDPVYHDYAESRLLGLGLAAGTSCLAVFLGVRNVLGITPAMAMRPKAAEAGNYFELPEQMRRRMSAMGRMAARSLLRKAPGREDGDFLGIPDRNRCRHHRRALRERYRHSQGGCRGYS